MAEYVSGICNTTNWSACSGDIFETLYTKMTSLTVGSSPNMLAALQNLYNKLLTLTELAGERQTLKAGIITNMKIGTDETAVLIEGNNHALSWNPDYSETKFFNYPAALGLPDGAATLKWDKTTDPSNPHYVPVLDGITDNIGIAGHHLTGVSLNRYAYPVPLYYYANSKVKVSADSQSNYYQDNQSSWSDVLEHYNGTGVVSDDVHSIALHDPVQYAVSRLDVVLWGVNGSDDQATTLTDDAGEIVQMSDIELTGILVTGQQPSDFHFAPITTDNCYTLYDNSMNAAINLSTNKGKDGSAEKPFVVNHTLVLPTVSGEDVYLFFEFKNNSSKDITVKGGLVPPGCKLYLMGKILGTKDSSPLVVFESDHVTTITGTVNSLENAYNVVPPREVGISVHLQVGVKDWVNMGTTEHPVYNW